jgi:hypothetical protein
MGAMITLKTTGGDISVCVIKWPEINWFFCPMTFIATY